jgi:dUTP pyrophosphatase
MILKIKKIHNDARTPSRAHRTDAGIDLYACGEHVVAPGVTATIPIGIAFEIQEGYVGLIWDKSSLGSQGMKTLGGVIDAGYRGEVHVVVHNLSDDLYTFLHGHKVAQMLIQKVELCDIEEISQLSSTPRGDKGFGSTGVV